MFYEQPHKIKHHASKMTAYVTPRGTNPVAQRRGTVYFEFEHYVKNGLLRANWPQKAITFDEYMEARANEQFR